MSIKNIRQRIGLGFKGVLVGPSMHSTEKLLSQEHFLDVLPLEGAISGIQKIIDVFPDIDFYIISREDNLVTQRRISLWIRAHEFFSKLVPKNEYVLFARTREEKGVIAKKIGIDIMIDDRAECLKACEPYVENLLYFKYPERSPKEEAVAFLEIKKLEGRFNEDKI